MSSKKRQPKPQSQTRANLRELSNALINNGRAVAEGPKKRTWTKHDLKYWAPITEHQEDMVNAYFNGYDICGYGTAGTGKSLVALHLALLDVLDERTEYNRIIIVRSIVSTRDPGALPGNLDEKSSPHEAAYPPLLQKLVGKPSTYTDMKDAGLIEFHITSFLRGLTWDNSIIVFDEAQNTNFDEFNTVMSRVGEKSRVIVLGDISQNDLKYTSREVSGMHKALQVISSIRNFAMIQFTTDDIVRSSFVRDWIIACEELAA